MPTKQTESAPSFLQVYTQVRRDRMKHSFLRQISACVDWRDETIATARSNKVAVCLGFQDFSQLTRDYGYKESKVIQNTVGNVFSSQVVGAPRRPSPNDSGRFYSNDSP